MTSRSNGGETRSRRVSHAAARGVVAAMSMSGLRTFTTRLGLLEATPPEMISDKHAPRWVQRQPAERQDALVVAAHWLYGAVGGAAFGALPDRIRLKPWAGPIYGLSLWLAFEIVLVPALGLRLRNPPSVRQRVVLAADHLLYGAVLSELRRTPRQ